MERATNKADARKAVRAAQAAAAAKRRDRERANLGDLSTLIVAVGKVADVDAWVDTQIEKIHVEAELRRQRHRVAAGAAVQQMRFRGETLAAIAELSGVSVSALKSYVRAAQPADNPARAAVGSDLDEAGGSS